MKKDDLVFLSYATNNSVTTLTDDPPPGVSVDIKKGEWSFDGKTYKVYCKGKDYRLWQVKRTCDYGSRHGPIGVYDRTKVDSLNMMLHDSRDATRERPGPFDD